MLLVLLEVMLVKVRSERKGSTFKSRNRHLLATAGAIAMTIGTGDTVIENVTRGRKGKDLGS